MKTKVTVFLVLFLAILVSSCSAGGSNYKDPPHLGVFLVDKRNLIEIPTGEYFGIPRQSELENIVSTPNTEPVIVFYNPDLYLAYLSFIYVNEKDDIRYNSTPKENGIVEIRPAQPLLPGNYCFIQGDPLSAFLQGWCFRVEGGVSGAGGLPSADSSTDKADAAKTTAAGAGPNWLLIGLASVLTVGLAFLSVVLWRSGKMKAWSEAGFSASKWRVQSLKLNTDQARLQKERDAEVNALGKIAWESRVSHPDYAEPYSQLEDLEGKRSAKQAQVTGLENELGRVRQIRSETNQDFTNRITDLQNKKKAASNQLTALVGEKNNLNKKISSAQAEVEKAANEVESLKKRLDTVNSSAAADKEEQSTTLLNAIAALEQAHAKNLAQIPDLQAQVSRIQSEVTPLEGDIKELEIQVAQLQEDQKRALGPLDDQIRDMQDETRKLNGEISALSAQMTPLVSQLGPKVNQARPEAPSLAPQYAQIDRLKDELTGITQQNDLLKARLSAADSKAIRNFFLLIALYIVALILIIVLFVAA